MSFDPTPTITVSPPRAIDAESGLSRYEPLITPQQLKDQYLFGIPLKSMLTKQEMSDDTLMAFIHRAINEVEHAININITPVTYEDRYDYRWPDFCNFQFIQLQHYPVISVITAQIQFPNAPSATILPSEWIAITNETGILRIVPTSGTLGQFFIYGGGGELAYLPLILGARTSWPLLFSVTYQAGFQNNKIPCAVNSLIATVAALKALELLGPATQAFMSHSIGIDGVSQGVGMAGPQWLQGRIQDLIMERDRLIDLIKRYYSKAIMLTAI